MIQKYLQAILGATLLFASACSTVSENTQTKYNAENRSHYDVPLGTNYTGRSPYLRPHEEPVQVAQRPAPAPAAAPAAPAPARTSCETSSDGLLEISKRMPAEVAIGDEFYYEVNVKSLHCAGDVVVTDLIPEGSTFVRSEPATQPDGQRLVWRFSEMDAGQNIPIRVWIKATREGTIRSCAIAHASPRACGETKVGRALIAIQKTGPETALLNSDITYTVTVSNRGSSVARNVVVVDNLPEGLTSANGQSQLTFNIGDLAPGQSRTLPVAVKATKRGRFCNTVAVRTSNAGEAKAEACTTVLQPGLNVVKTGPKEQFLNREATYTIKVTNTGDTAQSGVVVTDTAPPGTSITAAPGATVSGSTATWNVASMRPGEEKSFTVTLTSAQAGNHCNRVAVATREGLRGSAEACTIWTGIGAILLEVVDDPDPIIVDDQTTYTIRVTNQGTANLNNIKTAAEFDDEVSPTSASAGTVSGQKVTFPTVPSLAAKQSFSYTVKIKGVKAGDSRNRVTITCDEIPRPVVEEESTRVY